MRKLLDSIVQQTYVDVEVVISDDTPDPSVVEHVIADYSKLSIRYFHHDSPLGSPENWNFAYDKAQGEYIKLMHDDDWFATEDALEQMLKGIEDRDMLFCQSKDVDADGNVVYSNSPTKETVDSALIHPARLLMNNWIGAPSCMLHRRSNLRYDKNLKWFVDVDFYIMQISHSEGRLAYVMNSMVNIGVDGLRVSNECITNMQVIGKEYFYCLKKYYRLHLLSFKEYCYLIYCFARDYKLKTYAELKPFYDSALGKLIYWIYKKRRL